MSNKVILLLKSAKQNGVHISVDKGNLQLKLDKAIGIDPKLLQEIKDNKEGIIDFLNSNIGKPAKRIEAEKPLAKHNRDAGFKIPLSFSQERLWFIDQLEGTLQYHLPTVLRLKGNVNKTGLAHALKSVVERHESLRSIIFEENGETYQRIIESQNWELTIVDRSAYRQSPESLHQYITEKIREPFNLSKDYMLRAALVMLDEQEYLLIITMHHIASDGWSLPIIVKEVAELYESYVQNRSPHLSALQIQYADYAIWQRENLQGNILNNKLEYWKKKLEGVSSLQLPTDFKRPSVQSTRGNTIRFNIDKHLADDIHQLCQQQGSTLFMTMLAAFKVLLHKYSGQEDICVGTPIAGRQQEEVQELIGFFVNTLALRTLVNGEDNFTRLLAAVKNTTVEAYENQEAPFEKVVEVSVKERTMSHNPLFQIIFILQNIPDTPELKLPGLSLIAEKLENNTSKFDISFSVTETPLGLNGSVEYCTDLFTEQTIIRLIDHYKELLVSIVKNPYQKVGLLPMLTISEEQQLLFTFNNTAVPYVAKKSIIDIFEEQVLRTPENIAVVFEEQQLTYQELNLKANQLANYLRSKGVNKETLVPIFMERSAELIVAILAILKAGGAYVPIDADYPPERIKYMLEDTAATIVVTNKKNTAKFSTEQSLNIIRTDGDWSLISQQPADNLAVAVSPHDLAYIMYTSGSTGRPKGVQVKHSNVVSLITEIDYVELTSGDVLLSTGSPSFDATTFEYWGMLLNGGRLILCTDNNLLNSGFLKEEIQARKVSNMWFTSSWFNQLIETDITIFGKLKTVLVGGEKLSEKHIQKIRKTYPELEIINGYGPTENTTFSLTYNITDTEVSDSIQIGRPLNNRSAYILDKYNQLTPIGVAGEIFVGGAGVSRGYLNKPELTAEKFIKNPFNDDEDSKLYKTGDLGHWLPDGNIAYLGRLDEQVKIRGYRIEPGEIENVLQQCELVKQAVITVREDSQLNKQMVGYIVPNGAFNKQAIIDFLSDKLPAYMLPALWVEMESLPLTPNGKIDKKALQDPDINNLIADNYVAPESELEKELADIWQNLLSVQRVGINDNFFELGGHSLLAMRVVSAIRHKLQAEVAIKDLFTHPTIAALAKNFQMQGKGLLLPAIEAVVRPEHIPLSFSQERLWFIDRLEGSVQYHLPSILRLKGNLDKDALVKALQYIVSRHEILRTAIREEQGKSYQWIKEKDNWKLDFTDGTIYKNREDLQQYIHRLIKYPFNLSDDYMLRANLITLSEKDHLLVVVLHHIAADGWSISVIVKELAEIYTAISEGRIPELALLKLQYADYAIWQRNYLQGSVLDNKLNYWKNKLNNVATLELPLDYKRPAVQSTRGAHIRVDIDKELLQQLNSLSLQQGSTLFMTMLAAFNILLHRYSGQEDICVGTPVAGRNQQEVESLIGFFINTLALRSDLSGNPSFTSLLQQVKTTTLEAYAHQDVPFEKVVEVAGNARDLSRNPLFQVLFTMQNTPKVPDLQFGEIVLSAEGYEQVTSQLDLICNVTEAIDGLQLNVVFCTALFSEHKVIAMMAHFKQLLTSVVEAPYEQISSFVMLSQAEEEKLLVQFNDTDTTHIQQKTIITLFEEQVAKTPDNIAIVFEQQQLTYQQLNEKANQLANFLIGEGVEAEQLIPVCVERSVEMLIIILGILKSGAAYVPVDPAYPEERINYLLADTNATITISNKSSANLLKNPSLSLVLIDEDWERISKFSTANKSTSVRPGHLAYIIYTSGSTGRPKGVMIEHKSLCNYLLNNKTKYISNSETTSGTFVHLSYTFDASLTGLFMPLLTGKLIVISSKKSLDIFEDKNLEKYAPYDFLKITPSHLELLRLKMRMPNGGVLTNKLVIGGEALLLSQLNYLFDEELDITVVNEYGPTEATVGCSTYSINTLSDKLNITNNNSMSIGKPIDNMKLYILGSNRELLPIGATGELCIAGAGLARGYLNHADLTAEKFLPNPYEKIQDSKLYKTGDLARWSPDGNITFLGRKDEQVKIRGHRVELGEIESVLQECDLVKQAVVVAKESAEGTKRLMAYIVAEDVFDKDDIVSFIESRLPDYMIPVQWVALETMPLTINGKVDRKALPDADFSSLPGKQYVAPRNEMEEKLTTIWQELLDVEKVGIHDNFFELGGDSIIIIQIVSRARREGYEFQVADIFTYQTIATLSAAIEQTADNVTTINGEQETLYGLSGLIPIQQWYLKMEQQDVDHFNQGVLLSLDKTITASELRIAIELLTAHHDALRFKYIYQHQQWMQEYSANKCEVTTEDLQAVPLDLLSKTITEKASKYQHSLSIANGEVVRTVLMQTPESESKNRLLIIIHHLVIDGVSWRILLGDLELILSGLKSGKKAELGPKTSSYRQWYSALEKYGLGKRLVSQENYWQQATKNYAAIPTDKNDTAQVKVKDIALHSIRLGTLQTNRLLQEVPRVYHTEINDILIAALALTINEWAGKEKVNIGVDGHGREHIDNNIDTHRTVGWFTSLYPLSLSMPAVKTEANLIKSIKEQLRQLPDKGLGYGVLKYINKKASLHGPEPWDITFNYLGQLDNIVKESKWLSGAGESQGPTRSNEQITGEKISITGSVRGNELSFNWAYSTKHFHEETIKSLSGNYLSNLEKLIDHCINQYKKGEIYTPSDYGLGAEITYEELDRFLTASYNGKERKQSIAGLYRLSGLQEGMLFHGLYEVNVGAYIEQLDCELFGVDIDLLNKSWLHLIKQHSILRTAFYFNEFKVPVQCVYKEVSLPLNVFDYRSLSTEEQVEAIKKYDEEDRNKGFDFKAAPLMRLGLFRLSDDRYRMLWTSHHILFDGWSFPILMTEFLSTYELLISGKEPVVAAEDHYEDYIRFIERSDKVQEEEYWRKYLSGIEQSTHLPFIQATSERNKGLGTYQKLNLDFDHKITSKIQSFAQRHHLTVNTLMQGVWAYLLHQYTGMKDVVYGIIVSGRPDNLTEVEQRVGMYINTLLFRSAINEDQGVTEWLKTIQAEQVTSRQYQHTPLHVAQGWAGVQGDLFDTLLTFENYPVNKLIASKQWALNVLSFNIQEQTNYPLSILITSAEQIKILFSYNADLLNELYVTEIKNHFEHVLLQLIGKEESIVSELNLLTSPEEQQLLTSFNNTDTDYKTNHSFVDLFEKQVAVLPNALAIVFKDETLTYQQLNEQSSQLAHYLKSIGVKKETLVPVCTSNSLQMMVSILAILKAGGAYVPIDPDFPEERINYILKDTNAQIVITGNADKLKSPETELLNVIEINSLEFLNKYPSVNSGDKIDANQLAYIIYTSGSTGTPKGVMIEHGSLLNYLLNSKTSYVEQGDNIGSYIHLSYTFDASLTAIFMPLLFGKAVVVGSKQSVDVFEDKNLLKYAPYDFIKITPSHLEFILPQFKAFSTGTLTKTLVIGGEALHQAQFDSFIANDISVNIINEYGPTEATIGCTTYHFNTLADQEQIKNGIPIGKAIDNAGILIVNESGNLVPVGVKGQICISGAGIARGYLNQPALTEAKFIRNKFNNKNGNKLYKTGDIGRWLPDGNIEYLGRIDDQVKIRGHRVELGEVEHALQLCDEVNQGVVLARKDKEGGNRLVSYYVPDLLVLKAKERELHYQRVDSWKELYEIEYGQTENDENIDPEFNIIGWNDSFTGSQMPAAQMHEWLDDIVNVVLSDKPDVVLEIGCGTGLIYYQLAGKVRKYIGSDLSKSSINQIKERINKQLKDYGDTELYTAPAHEVRLSVAQHVDTILLNSIVQYFPGEDYMDAVMENCMNIIEGNGRIIIGDVRDNRLLQLFKARLRLQKLQDSVSIKEFNWGIEQDLIKEEELCFSPDYFYGLQKRYPQITHVSIEWKKASYINELSLYRFTVILYVGIQKQLKTVEWQSPEDATDLQQVFSQQMLGGMDTIAFKNIPNARLENEQSLQQALRNKSLRTVGDIMASFRSNDQELKQMNQLSEYAQLNGYSCRLFVNEDPLKTNLLFEKFPADSFIQQPTTENAFHELELKTNIPLFTDINSILQKDINNLLHTSLPEYMIPSELFALRQLPLTNNGKVDRLFLSQREDRVFVNKLNYLPPITDTEIRLAEIWTDLLHLERVGIEDNFFDLGGHSLLAMRVISAIRKQLEVELSIKEIFVHPTIGSLASHIQKLNKGLLLPSIEVANPKPVHIPLSFSQERLWFIDQLDGSLQYHVPAVLRLKGNLDKNVFSEALQEIINRHEVLRTVMYEEQGQGYQRVKEKDGWQLLFLDGSAYRQNTKGLQQYIKQLIDIPFDLTKDYMLRAALIKLDEHDYILVATLHHIASDGWSVSIMVNELTQLYNSCIHQQTVSLTALPIQYADFAIWQRKYLQGDAWNKKLGYWKEKLQGVTSLQLPTDYPRPLVQSTQGAIVSFSVDKMMSDQLQTFSQQQGVTLFMTLLSALNVLLHRYSGQPDICIGTPIAGRQQHELEGLIGFFINTLALRSEVDSSMSFSNLLQQVKTTTLDAYDYQDVPFEKVVEAVAKERDMSRTPLFQVMLVLQNIPSVPVLQLGDVRLSPEKFDHTASMFDLTVSLMETDHGLQGTIEYCSDLFQKGTVDRMAGHFVQLLKSVLKEPSQSVSVLPMLTASEQHQLIVEFNNTQVNYPDDKSLIELFEEQVEKTPEKIAVEFEQQEISYKELNRRANKLAHYLRDKGVKEDKLVPVCIERSVEMIVGILGILKAGGAYVPIDQDYPDERIKYMLHDTGADLALINEHSMSKLYSEENIDIIKIDTDWEIINQQQESNLQHVIKLKDLAYVIYTSGTTGKPKGVMIEHGSLLNYVQMFKNYFSICADDNVIQQSSPSFDVMIEEIYPTLISGGCLLVIREGGKDIPALKKYIEGKKATILTTTPTVVDYLNKELTNTGILRYVITGGDVLYPSNVDNLFSSVAIANGYGPSETTVSATFNSVKDISRASLIGKPIDNGNVFLLGKENQLVPIGVAGEICIGGKGLARGYLNNQQLTDQKFIPNPFSQKKDSKLYRTGDAGRWLADGNIEYLGRMDEQVKIRGYRIELGEIETVLQEYEAVRQAVVLAKQDNTGNLRLVAYVVPEGAFNQDLYLSFLNGKLPRYMIPALWVEMDYLPLTQNCKVDKKALPDPAVDILLKNKYVAPRTALEEKLVEIWKELLQVEQVGIYDDFFELGGHSLLAMRMVSYIEKSLSVSIPIKVLFQFTSINDLSKYLELQTVEIPDKNIKTYKIFDL